MLLTGLLHLFKLEKAFLSGHTRLLQIELVITCKWWMQSGLVTSAIPSAEFEVSVNESDTKNARFNDLQAVHPLKVSITVFYGDLKS